MSDRPHPILPEGPLRVSGAFARRCTICAVVCSLIALLFASGCVWGLSWSLDALIESRTWEHGVEPRTHRVTDSFVLNKVLFAFGRYDVEYVDAAGVIHMATVRVTACLARLPSSHDVRVRYLPEDPARIATSAGAEVTGRRALASLAMLGVAGPMCGMFAHLALWWVGKLRRANRCARHFEEVRLEVLETVFPSGDESASEQANYTYQAPDRTVFKVRFVQKQRPLVLPTGQHLAVWCPGHPDDEPVIIHADLQPFAFTTQQTAAIMGRVSRVDGTA